MITFLFKLKLTFKAFFYSSQSCKICTGLAPDLLALSKIKRVICCSPFQKNPTQYHKYFEPRSFLSKDYCVLIALCWRESEWQQYLQRFSSSVATRSRQLQTTNPFQFFFTFQIPPTCAQQFGCCRHSGIRQSKWKI